MAHGQLIEVIQRQSVQDLHQHITELKKNHDNLREVIETCSRHEKDELWEGIQTFCTTKLMAIENFELEDDEEQKMAELIRLFDHIIALATITLQVVPDNLPVALVDTASLLHGIMLTLPDTAHGVKNSLAGLFETWWNKQITGRDEIIANTFSFLLQETHQPHVTMAMIKRLWKLHDYLLDVDITMDTNNMLRGQLLQCCSNHMFYKCPQGKMFLSFLFSLSDDFILQLHTAIKQEIPFVSKSLLEGVGEVYFRAWQKSSGSTRQIIEERCLQNLMHQAAVAPRTGDPNMSNILLKLLQYIHKQKKQTGVDKMLYDLYSPFLWRYLKAPHSEVRANCAGLLMDVFPISVDETEDVQDDLMQKQYEFLIGLLKDPNHVVRLIAIKGVCHILREYWELIPVTALNSILVVLVKDLACDSSTDSIRQTVIQGLTCLVDNRLTHTTLQTVLPQLKLNIHDTSERVRVAMMDLLLKIKDIRTFKYWNIVPVKHILSHLTITESAPVKRRIMKLMFKTFFPVDQDDDKQIDRLVSLIEMNSESVRHFVKSFPQFMTVAETGKYMITVCRTILTLIKQSEKGREGLDDTNTDDGDDMKDTTQSEDSQEVDCEGLKLTDLHIMHGFLETLLILWTVTTDLYSSEHIELLKDLQRKFRVAVPMMLKALQDHESSDLIIQIAGHLPSHYVPTISLKCVSKLRQQTDISETKDYKMFLEGACRWQKVDDVFSLITDWLTRELDGQKSSVDNSNTDQDLSSSIKRSKLKGKKRVGFVEPEVAPPQAKLGLDYLDHMTSDHMCQMIIMNKHRASLQNLIKTLQLYQECGNKLIQGDSSAEIKNPDLILQAFTLQLKCVILLHSEEEENCIASKNISPILTWAEQHLLLNFRPVETSGLSTTQVNSTNINNTTNLNTTKRKRALRDLSTFYLQPDAMNDTTANLAKDSTNERTESSTNMANNSQLAIDMMKILLRAGSDVIMCGMADVEFCKVLIDLCLQCLDTDEDMKLLEAILICVYQTTEFYWVVDIQDDDTTALNSTTIPACLAKLYKTLAFYAKRRPEKCADVLSKVKKYVIQIFSTVIKTVVKDESISRDLLSTTVAAVIAELSDASQQFSLGEVRTDIKTLPYLTGWIIEIINAKVLTRQLFIEEIVCCINSEAVTDLHPVHGLLHLLSTLIKYKFKSSKLEDYKASLDCQINKLQEIKPEEQDSEIINLINSKMKNLMTNTDEEMA
ncbi:condensin-2 complex subunit G2 [Patella vulgata]|uniref:condensin-2 complex subunit G2 n=1 Tax=Patella vulgata TaxID=6465 RepID=UPI0021800EA2|nr:condensin-2 complex subunit G2 [Patella vulgata]